MKGKEREGKWSCLSYMLPWTHTGQDATDSNKKKGRELNLRDSMDAEVPLRQARVERTGRVD